jgi:Putative Ig domain
MSRGLTFSAAVLAATAAAGLAASAAPAGGAPRSERATVSATGGLGAIGLQDNRVEVVGNLSGGSPKVVRTITDKFASDVEGTALGPSGSRALIGRDNSSVASLVHVNTHPAITHAMNLNQFNGEGEADFNFYSESVAIHGSTALVGSDSLGAVQLVWKHGGWRIDTRVHSSGLNNAGFSHRRGFILFPVTKTDTEDTYAALVIGPGELPDGKVLAIAIDRGDPNGSIAVIDGVGTAKPKVVVRSGSTFGDTGADFEPRDGNGGIAFSPATPRRAVIATSTGFSVINVTNPLKPKVQSPTAVGTPGEAESISVSANGNVVAEAVGDLVYVYDGLLTKPASAPLHFVTTIDAGDVSGSISDVAYLANNSLAVVHGDSGGWHLTVYKHATGASPTPGGTVNLVAEPETAGTFSVTPGYTTPQLPAHLLSGARVDKHASQHVGVRGGIGHYHFTIMGKLPAGVKLNGSTISGTPKAAGTRTVTLVATNQYGGSLRHTYSIRVKRKG